MGGHAVRFLPADSQALTVAGGNIAPDCTPIDKVSPGCWGDITARALGDFRRALNFGKSFFLPLSLLKKAATMNKAPNVVSLLIRSKDEVPNTLRLPACLTGSHKAGRRSG
jgi:hypothetical protein